MNEGCHQSDAQPGYQEDMMLELFAFGLFLAVALAFAVWGPDVWRWITAQLGPRANLGPR